MAYWLKAAEDLFEVVDRRAKLVVSELSDEHPDLQSPASNGQESHQHKRKISNKKAQNKHLTAKSPKNGNSAPEQPIEVQSSFDAENSCADMNKVAVPLQHFDNIAPSINSSPPLENEVIQYDASLVTAPLSVSNVDLEVTTLSSEFLDTKVSAVCVEDPPLLSADGIDDVTDEQPLGNDRGDRSGVAGVPSEIDHDRSLSPPSDSSPVGEKALMEDADPLVRLEHISTPQELKSDSLVKIEEQIYEAQGLLNTSISSGQSKEARLARVCAGLSSRLQEYKSENTQLEELIVAERELCKSYAAQIKQLQQDLSASRHEITKVEVNLGEALATKNSEIEVLVSSMDTLKKQASLSEDNLASLKANMESLLRNRELAETTMMQALREELASAERRLEEERASHGATKMAAMEREVELEYRAVEASTSLARVQRIADERAAKAAELEQKVALLEVECASQSQELQDMEARVRHVQKKSPDDANKAIQVLREEVDRATQGQREAEWKLSASEAEIKKMKVEMAAMIRDAEHYSRQEHMELEKRYRELTDLLYFKQTQLEAIASEKAAAEFQLEKEMKRLQEAQAEAQKLQAYHNLSWEEDTEMKALEPLPLYHRHLVGASIQLQRAAKILDTGAARATRFLWRYPTARLILLCYLVLVHLFLMYLLHRLQEKDDSIAAIETAESMGLTNRTFP